MSLRAHYKQAALEGATQNRTLPLYRRPHRNQMRIPRHIVSGLSRQCVHIDGPDCSSIIPSVGERPNRKSGAARRRAHDKLVAGPIRCRSGQRFAMALGHSVSFRPRPKAARRNLAANGRYARFVARCLDYATLFRKCATNSWVAAARASLPMARPSAIGKAFGLAAATRIFSSSSGAPKAHEGLRST